MDTIWYSIQHTFYAYLLLMFKPFVFNFHWDNLGSWKIEQKNELENFWQFSLWFIKMKSVQFSSSDALSAIQNLIEIRESDLIIKYVRECYCNWTTDFYLKIHRKVQISENSILTLFWLNQNWTICSSKSFHFSFKICFKIQLCSLN